MRSRAGVKIPRIKLDVGTVGISIEAKPDGRATVGVSHEKLTEPADVAQWKPFWTEWLEALDGVDVTLTPAELTPTCREVRHVEAMLVRLRKWVG